MKTSHLALSLLFVSCTVATPNTAPPVSNTSPAQPPKPLLPAANPAFQGSAQSSAPLSPLQAVDRLQQASGQILRSGNQDKLSIRVMIQRPVADFSTQQLELSRIQNLRAWVEGPGLSERILNLNDYVAVTDQNQQTELVISEVPRGKHRVVTVQGYDISDQGTPPEVAGATLKAVYSSPENSTDVNLLFTWRSTAYAEIIESLLQAIEDAPTENTGQGDSREELQAVLDNLDETALNTFLDAVVFGTNPTDGTTYNVHPDRIDPDKIAEIIVAQAGEIPTHTPGEAVPSTYLDNMADLDLKVRTPQNVPFSNSQIQVQITDPASQPVTLTVGSDTADVPQVVPGTWDAIVKLDGLNGGVSARVTLTVDSEGNAILTEGTNANPIVLPPVITAIDKTSAGAGDQITLTGDGFDPDKTKNTVKFGDVEAVVISATATQLVVEVPAGASGTPQITVTSENKTSNYAELEITPKITNISAIVGNPGDQVTLTVTGYNPSNVPTTVRFNGSTVDVVPSSTTANTLTVTVPADATTGVITLTPTGLDPLTSPTYTIGDQPNIISVNPSAVLRNNQITVTGVNLGTINSISLNGATVTTYSVIPGTNGQPDVVTLTVPSTASSVGSIEITTPNGVATAPVTVIIAPTITNLVPPDPGLPAANLVLTGSNYLPVTQVSIGGTILPTTAYTIDSNNQITITELPDNPVLGPVKVTNPAGSATASLTYKNVQNFIGGNSGANYWDPAAPNIVHNYAGFYYTGSYFGTTYHFNESPHGVNVDSAGNIYAVTLGYTPDPLFNTTSRGGKVHKFTSGGTPVANWPVGSAPGYIDGPAATARFSTIEDVANDSAGNIYVADTDNDAIRVIKTVGGVLTVSTVARLPGPEGIEISRDGKLYVTGNNPPNPSGTSPLQGSYIFSIAADKLGIELDQTQKNAYSRSNINTVVNAVLVAGGPKAATRASATVSLSDARFNHLEGLGIDEQGRVYVAEVDNYLVRRIDEVNNQVSVFADLDPCAGVAPPCQYTLEKPRVYMHEIRVDRKGNVFIPSPSAEPATGVYVINPQGNISFIAGSGAGTVGLTDGSPLKASTFSSPRAIDFGPDGSLYVADTAWGIRKIERYHPVSNLQMP
jgi:streptogramin lyase